MPLDIMSIVRTRSVANTIEEAAELDSKCGSGSNPVCVFNFFVVVPLQLQIRGVYSKTEGVNKVNFFIF